MDRDAVKARVRDLIQERAPTIIQSFTIWSLSIQTLPISVFTRTLDASVDVNEITSAQPQSALPLHRLTIPWGSRRDAFRFRALSRMEKASLIPMSSTLGTGSSFCLSSAWAMKSAICWLNDSPFISGRSDGFGNECEGRCSAEGTGGRRVGYRVAAGPRKRREG